MKEEWWRCGGVNTLSRQKVPYAAHFYTGRQQEPWGNAILSNLYMPIRRLFMFEIIEKDGSIISRAERPRVDEKLLLFGRCLSCFARE